MPYKFSFRQKSPTRRFLLILGFATCIACISLGLMFMFWEKLHETFNLHGNEALLIGGLFLIYGILRFVRLFKQDENEEE